MFAIPSAPFTPIWDQIPRFQSERPFQVKYAKQELHKQAAVPADARLSLAKQYCCKRQRRVPHINMKKNNHIPSPTATNYYRRGRRRKPVSERRAARGRPRNSS